jgi:hypothetical protein
MNHLLVSRYAIFDESSFLFASSDTPPDDLDSLFSSTPTVRSIAPPYPSSIVDTLEPHVVPHAAPAPAHATRGPGAPARTTCGHGATNCATCGLALMLHRAPTGVSATTFVPRARLSVYNPIIVAHDPKNCLEGGGGWVNRQILET